jgi:hypothetical protein
MLIASFVHNITASTLATLNHSVFTMSTPRCRETPIAGWLFQLRGSSIEGSVTIETELPRATSQHAAQEYLWQQCTLFGTVMSSLAVKSPRKTIGLEERVRTHKLLRLIEDTSVGPCPAQQLLHGSLMPCMTHCTNQASKAYSRSHTCSPRTMPPSCLPLLYASHGL